MKRPALHLALAIGLLTLSACKDWFDIDHCNVHEELGPWRGSGSFSSHGEDVEILVDGLQTCWGEGHDPGYYNGARVIYSDDEMKKIAATDPDIEVRNNMEATAQFSLDSHEFTLCIFDLANKGCLEKIELTLTED